MKIVIVHDSSEPDACIINDAIYTAACRKTQETVSIDVAQALPKTCIGCFRCWVKTPGICMFRGDGADMFLATVWNADLLIYVTRIQWGGYSVSIKAYVDRMLPLFHPYFRKVNGEMHHRLRYGRMPAVLAAGFGASSTAEEETFVEYTASLGDQGGNATAKSAFVCTIGKKAADCCDDCISWLEGEISR